nr:MAG TPA: hypothetical protein [Caudoviricetes sp.]
MLPVRTKCVPCTHYHITFYKFCKLLYYAYKV